METTTLSPELLRKMDAYWRAAKYFLVGQIDLYDNPLLKRSLTPRDHCTAGAVVMRARSRR